MTLWYRTGTASVSNGAAAVVGTLTAWANQVLPGDSISFDGGAKWYEVLSVTDNTHLTLGSNFGESTVSGGAYSIQRTSPQWSLASELSTRIGALLAATTDVLSGSGAPSSGLGSDGSIYFDTTNKVVYGPKVAGAWSTSFAYGSASGSNGYVQFAAGGVLAGDAGFFWDNTNKRLGIGTTSPSALVEIKSGATSAAFAAGTLLGVRTDSAGGWISLVAADISNVGLYLGKESDTDACVIGYSPHEARLYLGVGGQGQSLNNSVTITQNGDLRARSVFGLLGRAATFDTQNISGLTTDHRTGVWWGDGGGAVTNAAGGTGGVGLYMQCDAFPTSAPGLFTHLWFTNLSGDVFFAQEGGGVWSAWRRMLSIGASGITVGRLVRFTDQYGAIGQTSGIYEDGSGNVGIGTASPSAKVHVHDGQLKVKSSGATEYGLTLENDVGTQYIWSVGGSGDPDGQIGYLQTNAGRSLVVDASGNVGIGTASFGASAAKVIGIANGTPPSSSPADMVQLYAEDLSSSSELKVRDEAGNVTVLSPHEFSAIPGGRSEEMAWAFHSERGGKVINVDMLAAIREVERLSGKNLVHISNRVH